MSTSPTFQVHSSTQIASLWSSYGHIYRLHLAQCSSSRDDSAGKSWPKTLILKSIHPPHTSNPDESHLRKLLSYEVERYFYHNLAALSPSSVKFARSYPLSSLQPGQKVPNASEADSLLLEDLSTQFPFPARGSLGAEAAQCVLKWLAGFHGTFFRIHHNRRDGSPLKLIPPPKDFTMPTAGGGIEGLWKRGTYFYLATRRDELEETDEEEYAWLLPWVEKVNDAIDNEIFQYGTLVHGDVKGANIIFSSDPYPFRRGSKKAAPLSEPTTGTKQELRCALYDLQYVGLGLATLDLVYFLGTSVESSLLSTLDKEEEILRSYHASLLASTDPAATIDYSFDVFWKHWELAIVDWCRFMAGWGFWGNDRWVLRRAKEIVKKWEKNGLQVP